MFYKLYTDGTVRGTSQIDQGEGWQELPECPGDTYRWDGSTWIIRTDNLNEIRKTEILRSINKEMIMTNILLIHLIQGLLSKRVIVATDFSATDRALYQKVKAWIDEYVGL